MNCERCQAELEDFLYGETSERLAAELRAHLRACDDCARVREELEREQEIFTQFYEATAYEPSGALWENIRARLDAEPAPTLVKENAPWRHSGVFAWLLSPALLRQAAFAVVLITASVAATAYYFSLKEKRGEDARNIAQASPTPVQIERREPAPTPVSTPNTAPTPRAVVKQPKAPAPTPLSDEELIRQQVARAEREYQNAIKMLDRVIARRRDSLDPVLLKQYESSLALIDESIAASRRALHEHPTDPATGQFLIAAYAKKVDLMQEIAMQVEP